MPPHWRAHMVKVVRTVLGDIAPGALGPTDAHEHLFLTTPLQPGDEYADVGAAIEEAMTLVAAGAASLVDWTPLGLGRSPEGLRRVSEASGLHIVAATGAHRDAHYPEGHPLRAEALAALADCFAADIAERRPPSGVIKVGASYHHLTMFEEKVFAAAAEAHARTGAPICVHTEVGTMGLRIVQRLVALGVPPGAVILAHLDRNPDPGEHAETAATGTWLQFDGPGRAKYWPDSVVLQLIADLVERGFQERLLLGGDTGRRSMMRAYGGGPGLDYLFARFKPRLERELGQALCTQIFVLNPAAAFGFEPPEAAPVRPGP
ncbi:MAG TPA: hypothetical protein VME46_03235 [Acidimicrobiales bacterium]|nr:hypothetical protein [Acidimicrobiales bacterium]